MEEKLKEITQFEERTLTDRMVDIEGLMQRHVHDGRETRGIAANNPDIYTGTAAPTTIPKKVGDIFCNTSGGKVYISTGVSASTDWKILN